MNIYLLLVFILCLTLVPGKLNKAMIEKLFRSGQGIFDNSTNLRKNDKTIEDCWKVSKSGIYKLKMAKKSITVRCEADFLKGGWIIIQRRAENKQNFYQPWKKYVSGFGKLEKEFWLGLENIANILAYGRSELVILMENFEKLSSYALYDNFEIGNAKEKYKLKRLGKYVGEAGDALIYHLNKPWSTYDKNNYGKANCAKQFHGAWWYGQCYTSSLNGKYATKKQRKRKCFKCMLWNTFIWDRPLKFTQMMIRFKRGS